jgi:hypothetical protein
MAANGMIRPCSGPASTKDMHLLIDAALHGAGLAIAATISITANNALSAISVGAAHAFELRAAIGFVGL